MRLRNIPGSREAIAESLYCYETPIDKKGTWAQYFRNDRPIHAEIGMGKGQFLTALALRNPQINYIGIEKYSSVLVRAMARQEDLQLPNLCLIRMDAEDLDQVFAPGELARIYLNFSDPWPKDRHAKRRLTSVRFLRLYDRILHPAGCIEFKTDNRELFQFSLDSIQEAGWRLTAHTWDLHRDPQMNEGNIMTEYEERFSELGAPICKLIADRTPAQSV